MKKTIKKIILLGLLVAVAIKGWNMYQEFMLFRNGDGTEYKGELVEDTRHYSSYEGNTINGSNLYIDEDGAVLVHYTSSVGRGGTWPADIIGNLATGEIYFENGQEISDDLFGIMYEDMIFYKNDFYGIQFSGGKNDESYRVVKGNFKNGGVSTFIDDECSKLMVADDVVYYQREGNLYRMGSENTEELLVEGVSGNYFLYGDTLYFFKNRRLHSLSLVDKTVTQLSEYSGSWAFMYNGRIYYDGYKYGFSWLMSVNPDGTNNKAHKIFEEDRAGIYDGKLYYVKNTSKTGEEIYCIDLSDEKLTEVKISVKESAKNCIYEFYGKNIEKRLLQFPESDTGGEVVFTNEISGFEVCDGYILFYLEGTVNQWTMNEAFLYNMNTKEVSLVNEVLGINIIYDYYLR